jgi:hypothetical protein
MFRSSTVKKQKKKPTFRKHGRISDHNNNNHQQDNHCNKEEEEEKEEETPRETKSTKHSGDNNNDDDNDDDDDDSTLQLPSTLVLLKRKKQLLQKERRTGGAGGRIVRSFDVEEEEEEEEKEEEIMNKRKKKKRKGGLGFGGGGGEGPVQGGDNDVKDDSGNHGDSADRKESQSYDRDALEKLKAEQKRKKIITATSTEAGPKEMASDTSGIEDTPSSVSRNPVAPSQYIMTTTIPTEESFISLQGDEHDNVTSPYTTRHETLDEEYELEEVLADPEESELWNKQIEKRAGIKFSATSLSPRPPISKLVSLDDLSLDLQSAMESMRMQQVELQNSINRRKADRQHTLIESETHEESLKTAGTACEYYQKVRYDLTLWVGALRDLQQKVIPIQQAFQEMIQTQCEDANHELLSWQDDCIAVLQENGMVHQILGRPPQTPTSTGTAQTIDEFGRDIKSQYLRDRDLRFLQRQQWQSGDTTPGGSTLEELCNNLCEDHKERTRCETLNEALRAALHDLDSNYTTSQGLKDIFVRWKSAYSEDYQQCYANLSLGDLLAVFLQFDLCKSTWFEGMLLYDADSVRSSMTFPKSLESFSLNQESTTINNKEYNIEQSVKKGLLPMLTDMFQTYPVTLLFLSRKKSQYLSHLVQWTRQKLQQSTRQLSDLENSIVEAIAKTLDGFSIPILNQSKVTDKSPMLQQSIQFARVDLVRILQRILSNIILFWFPLLSLDTTTKTTTAAAADSTTNGIHIVLNFINERFLMLLSSLDKYASNDSDSTLEIKQAFHVVWQALQEDSRNLLESPSLFLMTMPLRAAGYAYQVDKVTE